MENKLRFFLYARKSTDVEDKQVLSIDAQINELREFAAREGIKIVAELIEKQSAKSPGRPVFDAMLERLEAGEADGILAWHPDRLARNSVDGGRIIYMLDTGKIKTLKFPRSWFENTPQGKLMLHNDFGFSKYYVDSLSENTKRGLREKVRRGEYPGIAPLGYLNDYRTKRLIVGNVAEGGLLRPSLHWCRRHLGWWPGIVVADMGYLSAPDKQAIRAGWQCAVVTKLRADMKLMPPYASAAQVECPQGQPLEWWEYEPANGLQWFRVPAEPELCAHCWEASRCPRYFGYAVGQHETLFGLLPLASRVAQIGRA